MRKSTVVLGIALLTALLIMIPASYAGETLIWEANVSSKGFPVSSPTLLTGIEYRIVASGYWRAAWNYMADAQYYSETTGRWVWLDYAQPDSHSFLQINGLDVDWGPFSNGEIIGGVYSGHEYTIYRVGEDAALTFAIVDWLDGDYSNNMCHLTVRIYEGEPPPPEGETAYAYGGDYATCFKFWSFKNWGWSNGPLGPNYYEFDIYAGASKCNINKGTLVGTLTIDYDGSTAIITYMMNADYMMQRTHLYVDGDPLPRANGDYTTSPGQYPYIHDPVVDTASDTHTVTGLSGDIYVVAHADVVKV